MGIVLQMCICTMCMPGTLRSQRGNWIFRSRSYRWLWATKRMLWIKAQLSARTASTLTHLALTYQADQSAYSRVNVGRKAIDNAKDTPARSSVMKRSWEMKAKTEGVVLSPALWLHLNPMLIQLLTVAPKSLPCRSGEAQGGGEALPCGPSRDPPSFTHEFVPLKFVRVIFHVYFRVPWLIL